MINLIRIMEDRSLLISSKVMGVVGENNAEILKFIFPKKINDINIPDVSLSYKILTENSTNGYVEYDLNNDEFSIPQELTSDETLSFAIGIFQNNSMIWKSFTYCLIFMPGQNTNAESIVRNAVLKLNYDKLYDALAERDVELPEKSTSPTQTDVDGLISIVETLDDGESIRNAILSDIRGSFTENVGGDFTNKTFAEIIGTAQGEPSEDGIIGDDGEFHPYIVPYNDGEIYRIRAAIGFLANVLTENTIELSGSYQTVNGSISTIGDELDSIKSKIVDCLNGILEPEEPYTTDLTWTSIKELVDNLPDDVEIIVTQSVAADSDNLRVQIDLTIDTIVELYGLTTQPVRGSWTNTINNIYAVCAELAAERADYELLLSGMEEILGITEILEVDRIKSKIVDCLNSILNPDKPYTTDLTWKSIKELIDNLPNDVNTIVTQSISDTSDNLRLQIDLAVDTIIEQYELTILPVVGTWTNTINNIYAVCTAISELNHGGEISEDVVSMPFKYIENGVTTNLEFTVIDGNPVIKEMEE